MVDASKRGFYHLSSLEFNFRNCLVNYLTEQGGQATQREIQRNALAQRFNAEEVGESDTPGKAGGLMSRTASKAGVLAGSLQMGRQNWPLLSAISCSRM